MESKELSLYMQLNRFFFIPFLNGAGKCKKGTISI